MMNRRYFLTGVAAGVATALLPTFPVLQNGPTFTAGPLKLYPYQEDALKNILSMDRTAVILGWQIGKQAWAQLHLNQICRLRLDNIRTVMNKKDSRQ
jgi:hypothetical protein